MKQKELTAVMCTYSVALAVSLALCGGAFAAREYLRLWYALLGIAALLFPRILALVFRVKMTALMEVAAIFVIFGCCVGGEVLELYTLVPWWDNLMHLVSGFLFCAFGFAVWQLRDGVGRAGAGFSFSVTAGVMWEFFEYFCDRIFYTDMQKDVLLSSVSSHLLSPGDAVRRLTNIVSASVGDVQLSGYLDIGLYDTMNDLLFSVVGALVFLVLYRIDLDKSTRLSRPFIPFRRYERFGG